MHTYLVTVTSAEKWSEGLRVTPGLFRADSEQRPAIKQMMQGSSIELRRPDGSRLMTRLVTYGISTWRQEDGSLSYHGDPADPEVKLTIAAGLHDVPAGTQLWLVDADS